MRMKRKRRRKGTIRHRRKAKEVGRREIRRKRMSEWVGLANAY